MDQQREQIWAEQEQRRQQREAEWAQRRDRYPAGGYMYEHPSREAMYEEWEQRRAEQDKLWEQVQQEREALYGYGSRQGYGYRGYPRRGPAYGYGSYPTPPSRYGYGRGWAQQPQPGYQMPPASAAPETGDPAGVGGQQGQ